MINVVRKADCCGCEACSQACPVKCISMNVDEEGFLYPQVDRSRCIECGLCENVCPIRNAKEKSDEVLESYVAYTKNDEIRLKSSSGGVFSIVAKYILRDQGVIIGAAYDENNAVHHIAICDEKDLYKLRGSKYVQSEIGDVYKIAKQFLMESRKVLFTGTACQIAGLKQYLRKEYDNLYTIDVLCHGVPSPKVWKMYIEQKEKEYQSKVEKILFRDKVTGWKNYSFSIDFENEKNYTKSHVDDLYMRFFLKDLCLRPSCFECKYKKLERTSDLTIGDAWGISNYLPEMDDDRGTSIIIVHSQKGMSLVESVKEDFVMKQVDIDKALPPHADSRNPVREPDDRKKFFATLGCKKDLNSMNIFVKEPFVKRMKKIIKWLIRKVIKR